MMYLYCIRAKNHSSFAAAAMPKLSCKFMQLKCALGQALNPILEQGLQAKWGTSNTLLVIL